MQQAAPPAHGDPTTRQLKGCPERAHRYVEIPVGRRADSHAGVTLTLTGSGGRKEGEAEGARGGGDKEGVCHPAPGVVGGQGRSWTRHEPPGDRPNLSQHSPAAAKAPGELPNMRDKGGPEEGTAGHPPAPRNNDEAHYITTHEIQLCEADPGYPEYPDFAPAPSTWVAPAEDSAPCSFLEYASFDSQGDTPTDEDCSYYLSTASDPNPTGSSELLSSSRASSSRASPGGSSRASSRANPGGSSRASPGGSSRASSRASPGSSSTASPGEAQSQPGVPAGQILLSIKTASKAINEPSGAEGKQNSAPADAKRETDMSHCVSRATEGKSGFQQPQRYHPAAAPAAAAPAAAPGPLGAHRLVAVPARLQARSGLHADISSGASSAVSELDDADKEVRSLTSRAFRSLAYPYFEAISSGESTASLPDLNPGTNRWSTYLDWKGGSFLSQKAEQSLLSHQHHASSASSTCSSSSTFGLQKKDASKEQVYIQANKCQTKAIQLVVSELAPKGNPPCAAKRIQSTGSRVVTLTETLKLISSNVKAAAPGNERASKPPDHASACTDGVTDSLPRELGAHEFSKAPCSAAEAAMEGTHKSKFASSLLKNVISKKMQLEQEFKMERGELTDTSHKGLSNATEGPRDKGLQRQNSRFSEASSDLTLVSSEDLGDFFDGKSSTPKDFTPLDSVVAKQMSPFEPREESASDVKRSASAAMKGNFLLSQNSAFRSWKEKEIEKMEKKIEEKAAKARKIKIPLERDWRADLGEISSSKSTKMSRLYVPGIQHIPKEKQAEKQATKYSMSTYAHQSCFSRVQNDFKTEKLHVLEASTSRITPKPQEIQLKLGLATENKDNPFNIAKLLTPNPASFNAAILSKAAEELRSQVPSRAEVLEKMPQFLVRDVRETKPKVQGAIHQVRDVRKLLKGSYHHDTGDNSDKGSVMSDQSYTDSRSKLSVASKISSSLSPIVITCQAVKNKEGCGEGETDSGAEADKSLPGSADTILVHRASGRLPVATIAPNKTGPRMPVVKIVSKASKWKQEKPKEQEAKADPKSPQSRAALEKLTAAVKTMEQLYVFDKEWKRKNDPVPLTGSHVLSLIACEESGGDGKTMAAEDTREKIGAAEARDHKKAPAPRTPRAPEPLVRRNSYPNAEKSQTKPPTENPREKTPNRTFQVTRFGEGRSQEQPDKNPPGGGNRSVFTVNAAPSKHHSLESSLNTKNTRPQPPRSLKIPQPPVQEWKKAEPERVAAQQPSQVRKASADFENYLTIPVKVASDSAGGKPTASIREPAANIRDSAALCSLPPISNKTQSASPKSPIKAPTDWRTKHKETFQPSRAPSASSELQSPDTFPPATIYHHPYQTLPMALTSAHNPIFYSSPLTTATAPELYLQQTQRKMLVDLATGQYYLVDTPVQPVKRRLFDPETGQYVEVPMPPPPVTPVPLHMPPMALSPGAYGAAYMIYPGYLPTTTTAVLPGGTLQTQRSHPGSEHSYEMPGGEGVHPGEMGLPECPYYLATGSAAAASAPTGQPTNIRRGSLGCPEGKQVISILSQPGPRIVAPPSFDGTTMRFVVEHR
ncbi:hypothetical protein FKM82_001030 [Ascaphus truei]